MLRDTYNTIDQIKADNKGIGNHWFDADTMRFFNSRVNRKVYDGHLFVSSEQFDSDSPRLYSIRVCVKGKIYDLGYKYPSLKLARAGIGEFDWKAIIRNEYGVIVD
jgi:hypothetical protein